MAIEDNKKRQKITVKTFQKNKDKEIPISVLTAYDYSTAKVADEAEIDALLVGDSLGMVILGYENTLPVTMDEMLHHCRAVSRGSTYAMLIGDMPFMSYQISLSQTLENAGLFLKTGGMDAVKLEGGRENAEAIRAIVSAGIPVMGHLGLTPQHVNTFG
ncbi:MAG: 3-methyl-2-oxobutanoate hydroxymethyltransferase, partial [Candidatus Pacearchaeota archaeon]|nr:3-methyl-2-oxobutanoate hydroxymethyltransferase [Candidatus Pacearchaeota archaeon]